jgi:hypothetical protein
MSLNYDLTKVEDKDWLWVPAESIYGPDPRYSGQVVLNPKAESIIFACMTVDMGTVTTTNKVEFYLRYLLWCRLNKYDPYFSFSDLEKMVGLSTNVFERSTAQWRKWVINTIADRITVQIENKDYNELDGN